MKSLDFITLFHHLGGYTAMNKLLKWLFLFEKYEIHTKLSKQEILDRVKLFTDEKSHDYYGRILNEGFFIGEKPIKHHGFVRTRNSFAPVAKATITEDNGITTVSRVTRMHLLIWLIFIPIYLMFMLTVILFPFAFLLLYFAFIKPVKRLKLEIEAILTEA